MRALANKVVEYCRMLATFTEEPGRTTRTFLSPPMRGVQERLGEWMRELGMRVWVDNAGNLRGLWGDESGRIVIGSHLDTVPDAGAFDGILGVVLGVALIEASQRCGMRVPIEVIGFSEEEGVRFGIPFIGSRAVVGSLDAATLDRRIAEAIRAFGLDPDQLHAARLAPGAAAYLEFHIEQGPVLESLGLPLGVVDAIAGQSRLEFVFSGKANHAGTTPMPLRADALAAAAEWIVRVEREARGSTVVATVGRVDVSPNASNVIPGVVRASLDVRHPCDPLRFAAVARLVSAAEEICNRRGIALEFETRLDQRGVALDHELSNMLADAVRAAGYPVHTMPSGAGHDAMILAPVLPSAMLFLRSPGGISHHPAESVLVEDVEAALKTGWCFLSAMAANHA